MNQISDCRLDDSADEDSATGAMWRSGCRRLRIKHLAELLEAHGYTLRHLETYMDEGSKS
jgi:hypothetical protein